MTRDLNELKLLRYAIAVADGGGISAAAAMLGVEASAVSRGVHNLEDRLGVSLFERGPRGTILTQAGRSYLVEVRSALHALEQAEAGARAAGTGRVGSLRLGFVWSFAFGPIVSLVQEFRSRHSAIELRLVEDGPDPLIARLRHQELDVVLTAIEPDGHEPTRPVAHLQRMKLWSEQLMAALPVAEADGVVDWKRLAQHDLLCRAVDDHKRYAAFIASIGGPKLRFAPQDCSREGLVGLIAAGLGWSLVPESLATVAIEGVAFLPIQGDDASVQIEALWAPTTDNPALRRFLALARAMRASGWPISRNRGAIS